MSKVKARFLLNYLRKYENQAEDIPVDFTSDQIGPFSKNDHRQVKEQWQKMSRATLQIKHLQLRLLDKERVWSSTWDLEVIYSWNELGTVQGRTKVQRASRLVDTKSSPYQNLIYRFTYLGFHQISINCYILLLAIFSLVFNIRHVFYIIDLFAQCRLCAQKCRHRPL